jgi:hypothetical protein
MNGEMIEATTVMVIMIWRIKGRLIKELGFTCRNGSGRTFRDERLAGVKHTREKEPDLKWLECRRRGNIQTRRSWKVWNACGNKFEYVVFTEEW